MKSLILWPVIKTEQGYYNPNYTLIIYPAPAVVPRVNPVPLARGVVKSKSTVMSPSASSRTPDSGGIKKSKSGVMRSKQLGVTPSPARQSKILRY